MFTKKKYSSNADSVCVTFVAYNLKVSHKRQSYQLTNDISYVVCSCTGLLPV
jgi:hypothetical protein